MEQKQCFWYPILKKIFSRTFRQAMPLYIQKSKNENHAGVPDFHFCLLGLPPQTLKTQKVLLRPTLQNGAFDVLIKFKKQKINFGQVGLKLEKPYFMRSSTLCQNGTKLILAFCYILFLTFRQFVGKLISIL